MIARYNFGTCFILFVVVQSVSVGGIIGVTSNTYPPTGVIIGPDWLYYQKGLTATALDVCKDVYDVSKR